MFQFLGIPSSHFLKQTNNWSEKKTIDWLKEVQDRGVSEIIVTSIEKEGTGKGFDLELAEKISNRIKNSIDVFMQFESKSFQRKNYDQKAIISLLNKYLNSIFLLLVL